MNRRRNALALLLLALSLGCRSVISTTYRYDAGLESPSASHGITVGLFDFVDARSMSFLRSNAERSALERKGQLSSIWAMERDGSLRGLKHDDELYAPLSRVLRDLVKKELENAGLKVLILEGSFSDMEPMLKSAKAQGADFVLVGKINELLAQEINGSTPGRRFARGLLSVVFFAVIVVVWIAAVIASNGNAGQGAGLFGKNKKREHVPSWRNRVELSFWLCHTTQGCLWRESFSLQRDMPSADDLFASILPEVMKRGLGAALEQLAKSQAIQPTSRPLVSSSQPAGLVPAPSSTPAVLSLKPSGLLSPQPSLRRARCGNGVVDEGEACDEGIMSTPTTCRPDCKLPTCGDGVVDLGEACDDGNLDNNDKCLTSCTPPVKKRR